MAKKKSGDTSVPVYNDSAATYSQATAPKSPEQLQREAEARQAAAQKAAEARASASSKAAEKRANAREDASKKKAGERYLTQASNVQAQIDALTTAIKTSFGKNRDTQLGNIDKNLTAQLDMLKQGHSDRAGQFLLAGASTGKAAAGAAEEGYSNLVRERQDAMTNILEQGAGETDALRAMLMSARNWHSNASETNRSYFDSMSSINQGIVDLNVDTRSAMNNAHWDAEGEKSRVWQDFYNKTSEAMQQKGNAAGQQADYYANAVEMGVKPPKGSEKKSTGVMTRAYNDSATTAGKAYSQAAPGAGIADWKGQEALQAKQQNTNLAAALTLGPTAKAEGSSLREW